MRQNPGIKVTEVVKHIAKLWQILTKEEKQKYKEAAKHGKLKFWKLTIRILTISLDKLDKERYASELKDLTHSNKSLNKPKKPLTPYMLFVREVNYHFSHFWSEIFMFIFRQDPKLWKITQLSHH